MAEQVLLPVEDAKRIAKILQQVDSDDSEVYADLLEDHAENESFDDRWTEIGPLDEFIEQHA